MAARRKFWRKVKDWLIWLDEWANHHLLLGHRREMISSRCGRAIRRAALARSDRDDWALLVLAGIIDVMPWFGPNHCVKAIEPEYTTEAERLPNVSNG